MKRYIITVALALILSTAAFTPPAQALVAVYSPFITLTDAQVAARQAAALKWWKSSATPSAADAVAMSFSLAGAQSWVIAQKDGINRRSNFITALKTNHSFNTTAIATYGFPTIAAKDTARTKILTILGTSTGRTNFVAAVVANPSFTGYTAPPTLPTNHVTAYGFSSLDTLMSARQDLLNILLTVPKTYSKIISD
ncbi:MAG: hypothetical protein K8R48_02215 [Alphaproteobacteria bacterium]|nr:hypothetical protein [Alphaproteobacteria bacterium]